MKVCINCEFDYPEPLEDYFSKKKNRKDGFQSECKKCKSLYIKEHYTKNPDYYKKKAAVRNKTVRRKNLQFVIDYLKVHPCVDCGESDPVVLEFDHLRDKIDDVSKMIRTSSSKDLILEEIKKCEVRCANCHRKKTAKQFNYYQGIQL